MPVCPNANWQLRMRPTGRAWTTLALFAEPGTDDIVTWPAPYDIGFSVLIYADSQNAPFRVELADGSHVALTTGQGAILTYTPVPGERGPDGRITTWPDMTREPPELVPDLRQLGAESQIRAQYAPGTPLWLWGPGTAQHVRGDVQRLAERITRNPALVKHVPDSGDVRLGGPPTVECAAAPIAAPPLVTSGIAGWKLAVGAVVGLSVLGGLYWIARRA